MTGIKTRGCHLNTWLSFKHVAGIMSEVDSVEIVAVKGVNNHGETSGSTTSIVSRGVRVATFYHWKYRNYFEVVQEGEKNLKARCTLCSASAKPLSCARNTTSKFKKHLDNVHKTENLVAILPETARAGANAKRKRSAADNGDNAPKKQATLQRRSVSLMEVRKVVTEYIIDDMLPLSTVESSAFRKLVNELSPCPVQLLDRKALSSHIEQAYESMVRKIKDTLEGVDNVSTTADVWMAHHRSYLGMTVHWIDQTSLKRQKAAIACMHIRSWASYI